MIATLVFWYIGSFESIQLGFEYKRIVPTAALWRSWDLELDFEIKCFPNKRFISQDCSAQCKHTNIGGGDIWHISQSAHCSKLHNGLFPIQGCLYQKKKVVCKDWFQTSLVEIRLEKLSQVINWWIKLIAQVHFSWQGF